MICPTCGFEVAEARFCESCGCPLPPAGANNAGQADGAQDQSDQVDAVVQESGGQEASTQGADAQEADAQAPDVPQASAQEADTQQGSDAVEAPTSADVENAPEAEANAAASVPAQDAAEAHETTSAQNTAEAHEATPAPATTPAPAPEEGAQGLPPTKAKNTAFILVIVGLVLSVLCVTCIPGLVCSIVGLVLNKRNGASEAENPRRMAINIMGIVGIIASVLAAIMLVHALVVVKSLGDVMAENGWTYDDVQITRESDGSFTVRPKEMPDGADTLASSAGSAGARADASSETQEPEAGSTPSDAALPSESGSPSDAASTDSAAASSAASAASSAASSSAAASVSSTAPTRAFDPACTDALGNPTLFALLELPGDDLQDLLEQQGFKWSDDASTWISNKGALFGALDAGGNLAMRDIDRLPAGAADTAIILMLTSKGYASPADAFAQLAAQVAVEQEYSDEGAVFSVVSSQKGVRYFVVITDTGASEQTTLVYTEEAIAQGLFKDTIGIDAGATINEVWSTITGSGRNVRLVE